MAARPCPLGACDGSGLIVDETTRTSRYCACREQVVSAARARGLSAVIPKRYRGVGFDRAPVPSIDVTAVAAGRAYVGQLGRHIHRGRGPWAYRGHRTRQNTPGGVLSKGA